MSFSPDPRQAGWIPSSQNAVPEGATPQQSSAPFHASETVANGSFTQPPAPFHASNTVANGAFTQPPAPQFTHSRPVSDLSEDTTVPLSQLTKPASARRLKKPLIWTGVSVFVLLVILLGLLLRNMQQSKTSSSPSLPRGQSVHATPGSYTSAGSRLFTSDSPWNMPIGTNVQLDPHSSGIISQLTPCCHVPTLYRFGMPIYTSTASDPSYTVKDTGNDSLFTSHQPLHIPDAAAPSPGSDHWLFIYDKTQNLIFEMWNTHKDGDTWTTQTGDVYSPTGDGILQVDGSKQSGNGASYFGGVITDADIQRGYINHALSFAASNTSSTWRYPMNASDGSSDDVNAVPMGARLQLDPSVNCNALPGASLGEKMVCQALETYGGYVRDSGGVTLSMYFEGEDLSDPDRNPPSTPGNPGRTGGIFNKIGLQDSKDLSDIPWDKLRVLKAWNSYTPAS